jgi:AcrR family transcriptional regulator
MVEAEKPRRTKAERMARVLESAELLFKEKGFHDCGIAAIAEHAGVHVVQIYRDFPGKEGLIEALVRNGLSRAIADMGLALCDVDVREGVRKWVRATIEAARQPGPSRLIAETFAEATRNPAIADILRQEEAAARDSLVGILESYFREEKSRASLEAMADLLLTLNFGLSTRLAAVPPVNPENLAEIIERALIAVLRPPSRDTDAISE